MKSVLILVLDIVIALAIVAGILFFVQPSSVIQSSMEPTFEENDMVLVARQAYRHKDPQRGDIIVFESDLESKGATKLQQKLYKGRLLIKRVIAVPGDTVMISDGNVFVNGEQLDEPYLKEAKTPTRDNPYEGSEVTVPENMFYVMGDNREVSLDSRDLEVGFVPRERIIGRVFLQFYQEIRKF